MLTPLYLSAYMGGSSPQALSGTLPYSLSHSSCHEFFDSHDPSRIVADFNGDGKDDFGPVREWSSSFPSGTTRTLLQQQGYGSGDYLLAVAYMNGATITTTSVTPMGPPGNTDSGSSPEKLVGDFNGDGLADFFLKHMYIATGSGFDRQDWPNQARGFVGDFNGDGLSDILVIDGTGPQYSAAVWLSNGSGFESPLYLLGPGTSKILQTTVGDFNGDGVSDFAYYAPSGSQNSIRFYDVGGAVASLFATDTHENNDSVASIEFTGDGRSEAIRNRSHDSSGTQTYGHAGLVRSGNAMSSVCSTSSAGLHIYGDRNGERRDHGFDLRAVGLVDRGSGEGAGAVGEAPQCQAPNSPLENGANASRIRPPNWPSPVGFALPPRRIDATFPRVSRPPLETQKH